MRQRSSDKPVRNSLALDVLLPHASNHLRDVNRRSLASSRHHALHVVVVWKAELRAFSSLVRRRVENLVHLVLERLLHRSARLLLEALRLPLLDENLDVAFRLCDRLVDCHHRVLVGNRVSDADREASLEQPAIHQPLRASNEVLRRGRTALLPGDVNHAACAGAEALFVERSRDQLAALDNHLAVGGREVLRFTIGVPVALAR